MFQGLWLLLSLVGCHHEDIDNNLHWLFRPPWHGVKCRIPLQSTVLLPSYWKKVTRVRSGSPIHPPIFHTYCKQHVRPRTTTPHLLWTQYYVILSAGDSSRSNQSSKRRGLECGDRGPWRLVFRQHRRSKSPRANQTLRQFENIGDSDSVAD